LHTLVISVEALELSEEGVDEAVKGVVDGVLKRAEQIAAGFKKLWLF
jgi:hypothetical protein